MRTNKVQAMRVLLAGLAVFVVAACSSGPAPENETGLWPPPKPSDSAVVRLSEILPQLEDPSFDDVLMGLDGKLGANGYRTRFVDVPGGVAILTVVERARRDGAIETDEELRYGEIGQRPSIRGMGDFVVSMFSKPRGFYRFYIIYLTDQEVPSPDSAAEFEDMQAISQQGSGAPPVVDGDWTARHRLHVFLYEFSVVDTEVDTDADYTPVYGARDHWRRSGLM